MQHNGNSRRKIAPWVRLMCVIFVMMFGLTACTDYISAEEMSSIRAELSGEIGSLIDENEAAQREIEDLKSSIEAALQEIDALKSSNEAAQQEIDFLKSSNEAAQQEIEALKGSIEAAQQEIETLQSSNEAAQQEIDSLKSSIEVAQQEIASLQSGIEAAQQEIDSLKNSNESAQKEIDALETGIDTAQKEISTLKSNIESAQKQIDTLKTSNESAQKEIDSLKSSNESAQKEIDSLKSSIETAQQEIDRLKEQINQDTDDTTTGGDDDTTSDPEVEKIKIYIDQGHNPTGYHNSGAIGNGLYEENLTYTIGILLAELLEEDGRFEICLSRPTADTVLGTDNSSSLVARVQGAENFDADYFISLHINSSTSTSASGIEVYYVSGATTAYSLGSSLLSGLVTATGLRNRGMKTETYYVIKNTSMPAVLVELGFISNSGDAALLSQQPELFAQGLYNGILDYFDLT